MGSCETCFTFLSVTIDSHLFLICFIVKIIPLGKLFFMPIINQAMHAIQTVGEDI